MSIDIEHNKDVFISTYTKHIINNKDSCDTAGAIFLLDYLKQSDFFTAPCSTKYHLSEEGGLCQHSINVFNALSAINVELTSLNKMVYPKSTIAIVSLLHDLCKIGTYKKEKRWRKNEENEWENYECYVYNEELPFGHSEKSVFIITSYMQITPYEAQAIDGHMGFSDVRGSQLIGNIFTKNKLAVMLHLADMVATYFMED